MKRSPAPVLAGIILVACIGLLPTSSHGRAVSSSVRPANSPPLLTPIPDAVASVGHALVLPLSASDPDGDSLIFSLAGVSPPPLGTWPVVTTDSPTAGTFSWTPTLPDTGTTFTAIVAVRDAQGASAADTFQVQVVGNRPPRIKAIPDHLVLEGQLLAVELLGKDLDGDPLTFGFQSIDPIPPSGVLPVVNDSTGAHGSLYWRPSVGDRADYVITVQVADGRGGLGTQTARVRVGPGNNGPVITQQADTTIVEGVYSVITFHATDADSLDGGRMRWQLLGPVPPWASLGSHTGTTVSLLCLPGFQSADSLGSAGVGRDSISVMVLDRKVRRGGLRDTMQFILTIAQANNNHAPTVSAVSAQEATVGAPLAVPIMASDPDGDPLHFSLVSMIPPPPSGVLPLVVDSTATTGLLTWTPGSADAGLASTVTVRAEDPLGASGTTSFSVHVAPVAANQNAYAQLSWSATDFSATDLPQPVYVSSLFITLPSGVESFKGGECDIVWSPPGNGYDCGGHQGDAFPRSSGTTCTYLNRGTALPVLTADEPGHLHLAWANTIENTSCTAGAILRVDFSFAGAQCEEQWTFTLTSLVLLDAANNIWTLPAGHLGAPATIGAGITNHRPLIAPIGPVTVARNITAVVPLSATDPDSDAVSFSLVSITPSPPSGVMPVVATTGPGTGTITWTPADPDSGLTYSVVVQADDGHGGTSQATARITVGINTPPTISGVLPRTAFPNTMLVVGLTGSDLDGDVLHFSASIFPPPPSGTVPTVTDSGGSAATFRWTPGVADVNATYIVTAQVADSLGASALTQFTVFVAPPTNNREAHAQLSWSPTNFTFTDLPSPGAFINLYIDMTSGVTSYKGAEFDIIWTPEGNGADCRTQVGVFYKTSSGTTCTYLNRGSSLPIVVADEPGHLHVAWANTLANLSCTAGAIVQIQFEYDGADCIDPRTTFTLTSLQLLDEANMTWSLPADLLGVPATIQGGAQAAPLVAGPSSMSETALPAIASLRVLPSSRVEYAVPRDAPVDIAVYASDGRRVRTLVHQPTPAGRHAVTWDGRSEAGGRVTRGVYYVRATIGEQRLHARMVLLR